MVLRESTDILDNFSSPNAPKKLDGRERAEAFSIPTAAWERHQMQEDDGEFKEKKSRIAGV